MNTYLDRRGERGAEKFPKDFAERLFDIWLPELTRNHRTRNKPLYWTLKGYALDNRISQHPFMAWFRNLEAVAKDLYPERVPAERHTKELTSKKIADIQADYLNADYADKKAVQKIATKHGIPKFRVGQLCREQKAIRKTELEELQNQEPA